MTGGRGQTPQPLSGGNPELHTGMSGELDTCNYRQPNPAAMGLSSPGSRASLNTIYASLNTNTERRGDCAPAVTAGKAGGPPRRFRDLLFCARWHGTPVGRPSLLPP